LADALRRATRTDRLRERVIIAVSVLTKHHYQFRTQTILASRLLARKGQCDFGWAQVGHQGRHRRLVGWLDS
jgi:hypothetical protein